MLCIGPTGTGKTLTIADKLLKNLPLEYISHFLTFSARTSANQTQDLIDSKLDKRHALCSFLHLVSFQAWLNQPLSQLLTKLCSWVCQKLPGGPWAVLQTALEPSSIRNPKPWVPTLGCVLEWGLIWACLRGRTQPEGSPDSRRPSVMSQDVQRGTRGCSRSLTIQRRLKAVAILPPLDSQRTWYQWVLGSHSPSPQAKGCVWAAPGTQLHFLHR